MKTLKRCRWDEIKVGEVFAWFYDTEYYIVMRTTAHSGIYLSLPMDGACEEYEEDHFLDFSNLYKLPIAVQKNWIVWSK